MEILIILSKFIAIIAEPPTLLILAIIISLILYLKKQKSLAILFSLTSLITAIIIIAIKRIVQAPRPSTMLIQETGYSFPSGHTTFAVIFFGLLVYIYTKTKKQKIIYSITAALIIITIAVSRLQLQVHFPIDVIAGLIIGTLILIISILTHKKYS